MYRLQLISNSVSETAWRIRVPMWVRGAGVSLTFRIVASSYAKVHFTLHSAKTLMLISVSTFHMSLLIVIDIVKSPTTALGRTSNPDAAWIRSRCMSFPAFKLALSVSLFCVQGPRSAACSCGIRASLRCASSVAQLRCGPPPSHLLRPARAA